MELDDNDSETDVRPFPGRGLLYSTLAFSTIAFLLGLISMLWQHVASAAFVTTVQDMAYGTVKGEVGATVETLDWVAVGVLAVSPISLCVLQLSLRVLDMLTDD